MRLETFGELKLEGSKLTRHTPLLLLTYLSIEGKKPRRYLADLFYGHTKNKFDSLTQALKQLRKNVPEEHLAIDRNNIKTTITSDVNDFLNACDAQDHEKAIKLYQGHFVNDLDIRLEPELDDWVITIREYFVIKVRESYLQVAESKLKVHDFEQAVSYAEQAYVCSQSLGLELDPDQYQRVYTLLRSNKNPKARELKQEAEAFGIAIKDELIPTPKKEKQQAIPNNLPVQRTSFVGRDQELIGITNDLEKIECRLITLHGIGGIGKSRLALQIAYDQIYLNQFQQGIYFVSLEDVYSSVEMIYRIAEILGCELNGLTDALTQIQQYIGQKHILMIFDNYEHLIEKTNVTKHLLEFCANLKLIITSRARLSSEYEWLRTIEGLNYPTQDVVFNGIEYSEAIQLFLQRARRTNMRVASQKSEMLHVLSICQLCEGSPLAIELAASWVPYLSLKDIILEIQSNLNFLVMQVKDLNERHLSIKSVFEGSWKFLNAQEKLAMKRLSVFTGSFTREMISDVACVSLNTLVGLISKSLVRAIGNSRYRQHKLLQYFAKEKLLLDRHEFTKIEDRHAEYFFEIVKGIALDKNPIVIRSVQENIDDVAAAASHFIKSEQLQKLHSLSDFAYYFDSKSDFHRGELFYKRIANQLEKIQRTNLPEQGMMLIEQAWFLYRMGKYEAAIQIVDKGYEFIQKDWSEILALKIKGLNILSGAYQSLGNFELSKKYALEIVDFVSSSKDESRKPLSMVRLGLIETALGNYANATAAYELALKLYEKRKIYYGVVSTLSNLAVLEIKKQDFLEARVLINRALVLSDDKELTHELPYLMRSLGEVNFCQGAYENAYKILVGNLALTNKVGNLKAKLHTLTSLGKTTLKLKKYCQAKRYFDDSLVLGWQIGEIPRVLEALMYYAYFCFKSRAWSRDRAIEVLELVQQHHSSEEWCCCQAKAFLRDMNHEDVPQSINGANERKLAKVMLELINP